MANRVLRDTTDSEKVNMLTAHAEMFFYRLFMKADDYGCFHAKPSLVKAALFPLRLDSVRETDITRWLTECDKAGLIAFYSHASKPYLVILNFGQRKRTMKKRFPEPPDELLKSAASCGELPPENRKQKTENRKDAHPHDFDLKYFKSIGYDWQLSETIASSLNAFLVYRKKHPTHGPVVSGEQVEAILFEFSNRKIPDSEAAKMFQYTISKGAKNVIYEVGKEVKQDEKEGVYKSKAR